jgi:plastocyanin
MQDHAATGNRRPTMIGASLATLALALASCSSVSPSPSAAGAESQAAASQPAASEAGASQAGTARCALTADASPSATIEIANTTFGDEVTITAGQAVAFTNNDSMGHTITEGTGGQAATDACVDEPIAAGETEVVTFSEPGDYQITCKIHSSMQTVVHVE